MRPGRPRTAAAPGPRPHRSWSSIAAAGPRARAPPRWGPERRGPRHPQQGPPSRAHLVAEQLPHVHRTHRAPPPGTCRKPPGPCDTCRKAGGAGRVAGRHTAGKRGEGGPCRKGRGGMRHTAVKQRKAVANGSGQSGATPGPTSRVSGQGLGTSDTSPGAMWCRVGRERDPDPPPVTGGPPCPEHRGRNGDRVSRPRWAPGAAVTQRGERHPLQPPPGDSDNNNQRFLVTHFPSSSINAPRAGPCWGMRAAFIDKALLFIPAVINRCHLENRPITGRSDVTAPLSSLRSG